MSALSSVGRAKFRQLGGRCTASGITATIFGATGFLGRYVTSELGQYGCTMKLPYRGDEDEVRHLALMADLGQIVNVPFSVRDRASVQKAIEGSDIVINLMGKHYQTKHALPWWINYSLDDVHVEAARVIAEVAAECHVSQLIHVSSTHVSARDLHTSPDSLWVSSKARGEEAVKRAFPRAQIVRCADMYGPEDRFLTWQGDNLNKFGPVLVDGGQARVQPVNVTDVARGILALTIDAAENSATHDNAKADVFEFFGDEEYTQREIAEYVLDVTKRDVRMVNLPLKVAEVIGQALDFGPNPKLTRDWARLLTMDNIQSPSSTLPGLRECDVEPTKMEKEAYQFMIKYDRDGHFQKVSGYH